MKAAVLESQKNIRYLEIPDPQIGKHDVKIKVMACGICGSDLPRFFQGRVHNYPIVLGHEFSGEVISIGKAVKKVKEGDRVAGVPLLPCHQCNDCLNGDFSLCKNYSFIGSRIQGAMAEYVVLPERNVVSVGQSTSYIHAALIEPLSVVLHALKLVEQMGHMAKVAIIGCGTIGLLAIQAAKVCGAKKVTALSRNSTRLEMARELGVSEAHLTENGEIKPLLLSDNFDTIIDCVGAPNTMSAGFQLATNKAIICYIGTPQEKVQFSPKEWETINRKELRLTGSWMSYSDPFPGDEWTLAAQYLASNQIKILDKMIYRTFSLPEAQEAFTIYEQDKVNGKIVITPNNSVNV